jgi:alkylation response protein AidB-like acyl-CoA dehydrogenase
LQSASCNCRELEMALVLSDEQHMLQDAAKGFLTNKSPVSAFRALRDSKNPDGFDRTLWAAMAEQGFAGVLIPESDGGVGFGVTGAGIIAEQMGRTLTSSPLLSTAVLGASVVLTSGSAAQKSAILPAVSSGDMLLALACDEAARHAPAHIQTRATASGNGFKLNGRKSFVLDGHVADKLIVVARTSGEDHSRTGLTLFLVDAKARGVHMRRTIMVDQRNAADIHFEDVQVAGEDVIGVIDDGWPTLEKALDAGRAVLSAEMLGIARESMDRTVDYLKQRDQFGKKIGEFQALQHRAAHLFCEIELVKSVVLKALHALDSDDPRAQALVSLAKGKSAEVVKLATNEAVQMHGGIGMTDDFDIGFFMKRARAAAETFGDMAFHSDRMARLAGY